MKTIKNVLMVIIFLYLVATIVVGCSTGSNGTNTTTTSPTFSPTYSPYPTHTPYPSPTTTQSPDPTPSSSPSSKYGKLLVKSNPTGATIDISYDSKSYTTPHLFENLIPEHYMVYFEKDGYWPKMEYAKVEAGKTTVLDVALIINSPTPSPSPTIPDNKDFYGTHTMNDDGIAYSPDGKYYCKLVVVETEHEVDSTLTVYRKSNNAKIDSWSLLYKIHNFCWSWDSKRIAAVSLVRNMDDTHIFGMTLDQSYIRQKSYWYGQYKLIAFCRDDEKTVAIMHEENHKIELFKLFNNND